MRKKLRQTLMLLGVLLAVILASGCSTATPETPTPAPTMDLNIVRTEVAATVLAQVPQICALTPTATLQPTATATQTPTVAVTPTITGTVPTATRAAGAPADDQAKWISQSIADGTIFTPGQAFTMTWRLQNVGKTTWTSGYRLRFYSGETFGAPREIALDRDVPPMDMIDITVQMKAPNRVGKYRTDWVMSNETLFNFNQPVFLEITVAVPGTSTPTATLAPTQTSTPGDLSTATTAPTPTTAP